MKTVYVKTMTGDLVEITYDDKYSPKTWDGVDENGESIDVYGYDKRDVGLRRGLESICQEYYYDLQSLFRLEKDGEMIDEFTELDEGETIGLVMRSIVDTVECDDDFDELSVYFGNLERFNITLDKERVYSAKQLKKMIKQEAFVYFPDAVVEQLAQHIHTEICCRHLPQQMQIPQHIADALLALQNV